MRLTKINQKDVDAAVELLKSENKKVSVGNIAEYCGVDKPLLYWFIREGQIQNPEIVYNPRPKSEYKSRQRRKVARLPTFTECPTVELIEVTPTLVAYVNHIIDN